MEVRHRVALPDKEGAAVLVLDTVRVPVPFQGPAKEGEGEAEWVPDTVGVTVRVPVTERVGEMVEVAHRVGLTEEVAHAVDGARIQALGAGGGGGGWGGRVRGGRGMGGKGVGGGREGFIEPSGG